MNNSDSNLIIVTTVIIAIIERIISMISNYILFPYFSFVWEMLSYLVFVLINALSCFQIIW